MIDRTESLDELFGALADPTRRAILRRLRSGEASVGEVAEPFPVSLQAVSKHLRVLEDAGLVERRVDGRTHRLRLVRCGLSEAEDWIDEQRRSWTERLDELESQLAAPKSRRRGGLPGKRQ